MTKGQMEVARLIAAGLPDGEIATELGISVRTVKDRKRRAVQGLGYHGKRLDIFLVGMVLGNVFSEARLGIFGPRLRRTAELTARGLTNLEVAAVLRMTECTIKNYLREIFDLAGVWNRRELAGFVRREKSAAIEPEFVALDEQSRYGDSAISAGVASAVDSSRPTAGI